MRTGKLTYYHSAKDAKDNPADGVEIPLHETQGVKPALGKTKGTEHRITLQTPKREWELGSGEEAVAKDWIEQLQQWVGLPKVQLPRLPISPHISPYLPICGSACRRCERTP